jgi:hypothetical protein
LVLLVTTAIMLFVDSKFTIPSTRSSEITNPRMPAGSDPDTPLATEWPLVPGGIHGLKGSRRPAAVDGMFVVVVRGDSALAALAGAFLEILPDGRTQV